MRCRDRASWQYCRPKGVAFALQIIGHGVEPSKPNRSRNLFSKDDCRATLADEAEPIGPQVAIVFEGALLTGGAKRLTGARARPDGAVVAPSCEAQREAPAAETSEEMALCKAAKVSGLNVPDTSIVNDTIGDETFSDQVAQPGDAIRVNLVVVGGHQSAISD